MIFISCHLVSSVFFVLLITRANALSQQSFVIIGGTGRIGTAIATHLLLRAPESKIYLVGRNEDRGARAVEEVIRDHSEATQNSNAKFLDRQVSFRRADWRNAADLTDIASIADCMIHTAGPFLGESPDPLKEAISSQRCKAYVDVSDPLDFLDASLAMNENAMNSDTPCSALIASGAFPGMSNVLAMDAASYLKEDDRVRDVRFNYFTAGLGGSGDVNLYITNIGFGEPQAQYENGILRLYKALSGLILGKVDFFLEDATSETLTDPSGNSEAKARIGTQTVFSWPFPEAATVARKLEASGESSAAMGTSPDLWNVMLGVLVSIVPRPWWRSPRFSKFLADFSQPLVKLTDLILKATSPDNVGETHAIRVDVIGESGVAISCVQAHESFRRCVAQSCAEFALDLLDEPRPGVYLPEDRYEETGSRQRILKRLTTTPGTIAYTGPAFVKGTPAPTGMKEALQKANEDE